MKKGSPLIFILFMTISAIISIFVMVMLSKIIRLNEKIEDLLQMLIFFVVYGVLLQIWVNKTKNFW